MATNDGALMGETPESGPEGFLTGGLVGVGLLGGLVAVPLPGGTNNLYILNTYSTKV